MHTFCGLKYSAINRSDRNNLRLLLHSTPSAITAKTFFQFFSYAMTIPSVEIVLYIKESVMNDVIAKYSTQENSSSKLWKLVLITVGNHDRRDGRNRRREEEEEEKKISLFRIYSSRKDGRCLSIDTTDDLVRSNNALQAIGLFIEDLTFVQGIKPRRERDGKAPSNLWYNGPFLEY